MILHAVAKSEDGIRTSFQQVGRVSWLLNQKNRHLL